MLISASVGGVQEAASGRANDYAFIPTYKQRERPIYEGKFIDRFPKVDGAGQIMAVDGKAGEGVLEALGDYPNKPIAMPMKKFHDYFNPDADAQRTHYGQCADNERVMARQMRHGVSTMVNEGAAAALNPPLRTAFQQQMDLVKEKNYLSSKQKPLAKVPKGNLNEEFRYKLMGEPSGEHTSVRPSVRPDLDPFQVDWESDKCSHLYRKSHSAYISGEQKRRDYPWPSFDRNAKFGYPTPHDDHGGEARRVMEWRTTRCDEKVRQPMSSDRLEQWKSKNQSLIGKRLDPNLDTRSNLPANHTFGLLSGSDGVGAGDLLFDRLPENLSEWSKEAAELIKHIVYTIRYRLHMEQWQRFEVLWVAFEKLDAKRERLLSKNVIREAMDRLNVPIDAALMEQLLELLRRKDDEMVDYGVLIRLIDHTDRSLSMSGGQTINEVDSRKLDQLIKCARLSYRTTHMDYGATLALNQPTSLFRTYGTPSIRSDLKAPVVRVVADKVNYGDEAGAGSLLSPNVFAANGVYESDVFRSMSKQKLKEVLVRAGVDMSEEAFERTWAKASELSPPACEGGPSMVSFEQFRSVIDDDVTTEAAARSLLKKSK